MLKRTRTLWDKQDQHRGDRFRLFTAVSTAVAAESVLYPGSYVDLAASFVWPSVTYVDVDRRANQFFGDVEGVQELLVENGVARDAHSVRFVHCDYGDLLPLGEGEFDLLVSLYAGFISEVCTEYLRLGGTLMVNASHGDAAMAWIDPRYQLRGVVVARSGDYSIRTSELDQYMVPTRHVEVTTDLLRASGRGIAYTTSPFAYLFERMS